MPRLPHTTRVFRAVAKAAVLFLSLALIGYLLVYAQAEGFFDISFIDTFIKGKGFYGLGVFFALTIMFSAIGTPRQLIATLGGYAFGAWQGTLLVNLGLAAGCVLSFFYARLLARSTLRRRLGKKVVSMEEFLLQKPFLMVVAIRLFPLGNNTLTSMLGGVSSIAPFPFISGSFVGYLPQTLVFSLLGSGIAVGGTTKFAVSLLLFCISAAIGVWLYSTLRKKNLSMPTDGIDEPDQEDTKEQDSSPL